MLYKSAGFARLCTYSFMVIWNFIIFQNMDSPTSPVPDRFQVWTLYRQRAKNLCWTWRKSRRKGPANNARPSLVIRYLCNSLTTHCSTRFQKITSPHSCTCTVHCSCESMWKYSIFRVKFWGWSMSTISSANFWGGPIFEGPHLPKNTSTLSPFKPFFAAFSATSEVGPKSTSSTTQNFRFWGPWCTNLCWLGCLGPPCNLANLACARCCIGKILEWKFWRDKLKPKMISTGNMHHRLWTA